LWEKITSVQMVYFNLPRNPLTLHTDSMHPEISHF